MSKNVPFSSTFMHAKIVKEATLNKDKSPVFNTCMVYFEKINCVQNLNANAQQI
jgi:hypothetical protein